ncbi:MULTISPECIES: Nudix family hydrolase [Methylomicrobium]|uniref:8-oxo-dGTP diphosphatase n=1 Tax=Methylomicrobium album BG8 TaxID=686340 RepID=H8GI75_METAL|nr:MULTISPECIES: Nudix family hydrolase [Methylomicrobium]EIC30219.1 mutator mutT protein [Methylomicrobium album BG8]
MNHFRTTAQKFLQVAAGVIKNADGRILIARRDESLHQGGLWEFPGGKIEAGETPEQALFRELKEELDIDTLSAAPLITIHHRYPDRDVTLRVFLVDRFSGTAKGCQEQPIRWVEPNELNRFAFPAANRPIIAAAQLPPFYAILDDQVSSNPMEDLHKLLAQGIDLIQARLKTSPHDRIDEFLAIASPLCSKHGAALLINSAVDFGQHRTHGLHLTARDLLALSERPSGYRWIGASCHNLQELEHAQKIGADFAVLAPVLPTLTHPETAALGWKRFAALAEGSNIPVYALGGLTKKDLSAARDAGAQGIAGISAFLG